MQENISISGTTITGTLKRLSTGDIADYWGEGYFIALKFVDNDGVAPENIKISNVPLDADMNGIWQLGKIQGDGTTKKAEKLTIVTTDGENTLTQDYDISGLVFAD